MSASPLARPFAPQGGDWLRHLPPLRPGAMLASFVMLAAALLGFALLRHPPAVVDPARAPAMTPAAASTESWADAPDAARRFVLGAGSGPAGFGPTSAYRARLRASDDGARQDVLTFGGAEAGTGLLRVAVTRAGRDGLPPVGFFVTLARAAAAEGLSVQRADQPREVATRYGLMDVAEASLGRAGMARACLAFRLRTDAPDLQISGLACDLAGQAPSREKLVCVLETLNVTPAETDRAIASFFTAAALRHSPGCLRRAEADPPTGSTKAAPRKTSKPAKPG